MSDVLFLADAPTTLPAGVENQATVSRTPVARLGRFKHGRYGRFKVTREEYDSWRRNLESIFHGRIPLDIDHGPEKGGSSEAAGWITALDENGLDGNTPTPDLIWATVEWTPLGETAVREKRYLYVSPVMHSQWEDEEGKKHGPTMPAVSLTNRPHFQSMPAVSLSREDVFAETDDAPEASDSREQMPDFKKIAAALKLDTDADEAKVLEAIKGLARPTKLNDSTMLEFQLDGEKIEITGKDLKQLKSETKTLEQAAADEGKVVLDKGAVDRLTERVQAGERAATELATMRFERHYEKALTEGRIDAKDETKALYKGIFDLDAEKAVTALDGLQKIVNTEARGAGGSVDDAEAPEGVDAESFQLDRKVKALMAEDGNDKLDYAKALDKVLEREQVAA